MTTIKFKVGEKELRKIKAQAAKEARSVSNFFSINMNVPQMEKAVDRYKKFKGIRHLGEDFKLITISFDGKLLEQYRAEIKIATMMTCLSEIISESL
jgi:hypothetical protein